MKKLLLILMMLFAATAVLSAQDELEKTATPTIIINSVYEGDLEYYQYNEEYGYYTFRYFKEITLENNDEDDVQMFIRFGENEDLIQYDWMPWLFTEEGEYIVEAFAQADGKLPSDPVMTHFAVWNAGHNWCYNFIENGIYYVYTSDTTVSVCPPESGIIAYGSVGFYSWYTGDVVIPEKVYHNGNGYMVTGIGAQAFVSCSVEQVSLPNTITRIGNEAFKNSTLTEIDIPASVASIGQFAFIGTPYLERIHVDEANSVYDSREDCNAIIETATNTLIQACKNTVIPSSVPVIGEYAFGGEYFAYVGVRLPEVYTLPGTVTTICDFAYRMCNMKKLLIPNSVTSIGKCAFSLCQNLESVDLPESLLTIGEAGFGYNEKLTTMVCRAMTPPDASSVVVTDTQTDVYEQARLFVPYEALEAYRAHEEWGRFAHIVPFLGAGPGDVNGDNEINIADVTGLIDQLLSGEELPAYYDVDGDGVVNIKDITDLIDMLLGTN